MKLERLEKIFNKMKKNNMKQILISSPKSIFYLTGKLIDPGERMFVLYINQSGNCTLIVNELFPIKEDLGIQIEYFNDTSDSIKLLSSKIESGVIGIDKTWASHFLIRLMEEREDLKFKNGSYIVDEVRMIKDSDEIELMKLSSQINDKVIQESIVNLSIDYDEKAVCKVLGDRYVAHGADGISFNPLIAYGKNAAEPHHHSDSTKMSIGDSVIIDIGGIRDNYCSDMTRTVFYKSVDDESRKIYNIVLEANLKAISTVKPGIKFRDVDKAARSVIEDAGYGKYFTHRTGHNIGIEVHEFPDVSSVNDMIVEVGMIFSIEPGIYIPGKCGVRIEDLIVVTDNGCEVLNKYNKELQII